MSKLSVAAIKRQLVPGVTLRIVNHIRPVANRVTTVTPKTNTVDLCTWAENAKGEQVESHMRWPKAADLRPGDLPNSFHIDSDGTPFLTVTILEGADA